MHIHGLQKLAMVDYPGKLAATVFTGGCNLRCPFCQNHKISMAGEGDFESVTVSPEELAKKAAELVQIAREYLRYVWTGNC